MLQDACVSDDDVVTRPVVLSRFDLAHRANHLHALLHTPEYRVLAVQPRCGCERDEELRRVRVAPAIRHAQNARARVLELRRQLAVERPVGARILEDGFSPSSRPRGIATLHAHRLYDAVEDGSVVVPGPREVVEVFARARRVRAVQLDFDVTK